MYDEDLPAEKAMFDQLRRLLEARRIPVPVMVGSKISDQSSISGAVLKFKAAGVTHVYLDYAGQALQFMQNAESQRYRPRYAAWGFMSPGVLQTQVPAVQLRGALGAGFRPGTDVAASSSPGDLSAAGPRCRAIFRTAGLTYERYSLAETIAFTYCDMFRLMAAAATEAATFTAVALRRAFDTVGSAFESATVFRNAFSSTRSDASGAVRDLGFVDSCQCFRYLSRVNRPS
jgi:hypothetical protein